MNILAFGDMRTGCWLARIARPLVMLRERGHRVFFTRGDTPYPINGWDIVIFNNLLKAPYVMSKGKETKATYKQMIDDFRKGGAKIVYDTDDAQDIIPAHTQNKKLAKEMMKSFGFFLKEADLITTTTETLKEYLATKTNKPIAVLPNSLDPKEFKLRVKPSRLRVGFAGSSSHVKDLMIALPDIERLKKKYDFDFYVFGFGTDWEELKKTKHKYFSKEFKPLIARLEKLGAILVPSVNIFMYPETLYRLGFDIGICPLIDDDFNRNKSCIKAYEYSLVGTCAVTSDVLPYSEEPFARLTELERLITDTAYRESERRRMRDWVLTNRNIEKNVEMWEDRYKSIL